MIKSIYTLLVIFSTATVSSQNINLIKNTHPKARVLDHILNETRDSLILKSETTILQVEIFNEDYENLIIVENGGIQIPLKELPSGKFVVEAKLTDRIIVMDLIKRDSANDRSNATVSFNGDDLPGGIGMMLDEQQNIVKHSPTTSIEYIFTRSKSNKKTTKKQKFYWTITKVNNGMTSNKTMRLANQETVDKMISKHKLETKTSNGRLNELLVLEVYDKTKFIASQVANPDYINSYTSEFFNVSPYYTSEINFE
jgi:hypothetical protein